MTNSCDNLCASSLLLQLENLIAFFVASVASNNNNYQDKHARRREPLVIDWTLDVTYVQLGLTSKKTDIESQVIFYMQKSTRAR